jgi:hypothetical protein
MFISRHQPLLQRKGSHQRRKAVAFLGGSSGFWEVSQCPRLRRRLSKQRRQQRPVTAGQQLPPPPEVLENRGDGMVGENTRASAMQIPEPAETVVIAANAADVVTGVSVVTAVNAATVLRAAAATIEIAEKIARAAERRAATGASVAMEVAPAPNVVIAKHVDREAVMSRPLASTNKVVHAKRRLGPTKVPVAAI